MSSVAIVGPERGPLPQVLAGEAASALAQGRRPFVELYAAWCEPSRKVRESLGHPLMREAFSGIHVIVLDVDEWGDELRAHELETRSVPAFYELDAQGRATGRRIDGSSWGEDVPENMAPPLRAFFAAGAAPAPAAAAPPNEPTPEQLERVARAGPRWFYWIGGLSIVNSIGVLSGAQWNALVGLGVTLAVDSIAVELVKQGAPGELKGIAFAIDLLVAATFIAIGWLARGGNRIAYGIGIGLYLADGALLALLGAWPHVAIHAVAAFFLWVGFVAAGKLRQADIPGAAPRPPFGPIP